MNLANALHPGMPSIVQAMIRSTRRQLVPCLICLCAVLPALPAYAGEAVPAADDPVVEQRLNAISAELRCLVCQNESLASSRADLAVDLRREVRNRIAKGDSDAAIRTFLVERYGDFVLYRPPLKATTLLLWLGPLLLLVAALIVLFRQLRRRNTDDDGGNAAPLPGEDSAERERVLRLLAAEDPDATGKPAART